MSAPQGPPAPAGLGKAGKTLWAEVLGLYELRVDERVLLESACRTRDTLALLEAELEGAPLTVAGSMGQLREHPLLAEARMQRALLSRLLAQVDLPDAGDLADLRTAAKASRARSAASARWASRGTA